MKALLDACVLYPPFLRALLLDTAARGGFVPLWSARILAEWQLAAARHGSGEGAAQAIARTRADWPEAEVACAPEVAARLDLPDPADAHVLAAAIAGGADVLITANLRDFPRRILAAEGIMPQSPDDFLMARWLDAPGPVSDAARAAHAAVKTNGTPAASLRQRLKRAGLPRLGKALECDTPR